MTAASEIAIIIEYQVDEANRVEFLQRLKENCAARRSLVGQLAVWPVCSMLLSKAKACSRSW